MSSIPNDLSIYERYSTEWWDPKSPRFRSLQKITEFRILQIDHWFGSVANKTVVDLGCGGGLLSVPLLERGADVYGLDISVGSLRTASLASNGAGTYIKADARNVPLAENLADFVLAADVLDHIADYEKVLQESARLLKPGGLLYVNTINRTFLSWFFAIFLGERSKLIPPGTHDHKLFITPSELSQKASLHGLEHVDSQGEAPALLKTIVNWAITFRATRSQSIAYSSLFKVKEKYEE